MGEPSTVPQDLEEGRGQATQLLRLLRGDRPSIVARVVLLTRSVGHLAIRRAACAALVGVALAACGGPPVRLVRADPTRVQREMTSNALNSDHPSTLSTQMLQRLGLYSRFQDDPVGALRLLHAGLEAQGERYRLFALAELSYYHAERSGDRRYYLAAAVYAYALLFPELPSERRIDPSDPRLRIACDLYNRGLALALATGERGELQLGTAHLALPFGAIDVEARDEAPTWGGFRLKEFEAASTFEVRGLRNRYRRAGIGAPLVAGLSDADTSRIVAGHRHIPKELKVPVTLFLRIEEPRASIVKGSMRGRLDVYTTDEVPSVAVGGRDWPLEAAGSSAIAYTLGSSPWWSTEYASFFSAAVNPWADKGKRDGLLMVQPYRSGRIPLVLVHGTASSPVRWADLMNELQIDDRIATRYQIWLYIYNTGNPIGYTASIMRETLERAVAELDPDGKDAALREMVVVGHSQGGLLTKLTAVDSGLAFWRQFTTLAPDELQGDPDTLDAVKRSLIFTPEPFVKRVVFLCTPQHGSFLAAMSFARVAGSFVTLPSELTKRMLDVMSRNPGKIALQSLEDIPTSIDNMDPNSDFIRTLAQLPIAPGVEAHSIIAVDGDGPLADASDGVVRYESAHLDGVSSEAIVHSGHSAQGNPEAIEEIRRILLVHLRSRPAAGIAR